MTSPIPQPPALPFIGNAIGTLDKDVPTESMLLLAKQYGSIFKLNMLGTTLVVVNNQKLCHQVSDEKKFYKTAIGGLGQVRVALGDGMFTAWGHEKNWVLAHKLLMPGFAPDKIRDMFELMSETCSQLITKWARLGPKEPITTTDDFTRMAFETISLCLYSYRMNVFYHDDIPFVSSMASFLTEAMYRTRRPGVVQAMMRGTNAQFDHDVDVMKGVALKILEDRKANPSSKPDLLDRMMSARDPETGEGLPEDNIVRNIITFLVAGHETTSGLLSFATFWLLKHPAEYAKVRAEVDRVIGTGPIKFEHLSQLKVIQAVLRETLRLSPSVAQRGCRANCATVINDGERSFEISKDTNIVVNIRAIHRDPAVWGEDADEFRSERMMDENFAKLPPDSWVPWGNGVRACIGRPIAWTESQLVLAAMFQNFDFQMEDPSYVMHLRQTLTIKPLDFRVYAIPRKDRTIQMYKAPSTPEPQKVLVAPAVPAPNVYGTGKKIHILYGSNSGSSEGFAQRIAADAPSQGFSSTIGTLDSAVDRIPTDGPIIIVTASYEGEPTDNAGHFVEYIKQLSGKPFEGLAYTVYGCGNKDWAGTYQKIPKLCDTQFENLGAARLLERGAGDASSSDFYDSFDAWEVKLWATLRTKFGAAVAESATSINVTFTKGDERAATLRQPDTVLGKVVENRVLTKENVPVKRHIEFELPDDTTYNAGDYLSILPRNPETSVHRVLGRFKLSQDQEITIESQTPTTLPTGKPVSVAELLRGYVEISQPATKRTLGSILEYAKGTSKEAVEVLASNYASAVQDQRLSLLDILEAHPDIDMPFNVFLSQLPTMRVRQYSISSSPLWNPAHVTLTVGVLDAPAISGHSHKFLGVASNYLASLKPGELVQLAVRPSAIAFHLPSDPRTPTVMFCAGSGIAPMRGFLQELAAQAASGRNITKALLFFGCRNPDEDYLYSDGELKEWEKAGVVDIFPAFSRASDHSEGCKYVQDRAWKERELIVKAFRAGGKFFTCGSAKMSQGIKAACIRMIQESGDVSEEEAAQRFGRIEKERYATDVFD